METLRQQIDNFRQDVIANIDSIECNARALDVLRAITLDALLLEQRIKNEYDTQAPTNAE